MNPTTAALTALYNRIPRRHSLENIKDINGIVTAYEDLLIKIEAENAYYEKNIPVFFEDLDSVRATIKRSADNKASKKTKDSFFDDASGALKDSMQALMDVYADGSRMA
jgi:adenine-specific DNA glycosylase